MPLYMIEREIPGAEALSSDQQADISTASCKVLSGMGPGITWHQSYSTDDKITCIYEADNEQLLREHAEKGGFPITKISVIANVLSPSLSRG